MKIIVPIRPVSVVDALRKMRAVSKNADIIEIWLDGIVGLDAEKIRKIVQDAKKARSRDRTPVPLILNLKDKKEKGTFRGGEKKRIALLSVGAKAGAEYIDLPLALAPKLIRAFRKEFPRTKLILSWHDFHGTPKIQKLRQLVKQAVKFDAEGDTAPCRLRGNLIVKLVGTAQNWSDILPILQITRELTSQKIPCLTMAMGEWGEVTRILTPLLGALGMFAPVQKKSASAPGQLAVKELKTWWGL